jgi:hypothetical protein
MCVGQPEEAAAIARAMVEVGREFETGSIDLQLFDIVLYCILVLL